MGKGRNFARYVGKRTVFPRILSLPAEIAKSGGRIKDSLKSLGDIDRDNRAKTENITYIKSDNGKTAFEDLYKVNNWTEPDLKKQLRNVRIIKWVSLLLAWTFLSCLLGLVIYIPFSFFFFVMFSLSWLCVICFGIQVIKMTLFQVQLQERNLISLKALMNRSDLFKKIFS